MNTQRRRHWFPAALAAIAGLLGGCASTAAPGGKLHTVPHVDLQRYMGDWYVIGEIPWFAERNCVDSIESYALRADGDIDNEFHCRKKSFDAPMKRIASARVRVADTTTNARWRVRFLGFLSMQYLVLALDPDYQWVLVGHPSLNYGWIMARSKSLPDSTYAAILKEAEAQGYDPARFQKVPQRLSTEGSALR